MILVLNMFTFNSDLKIGEESYKQANYDIWRLLPYLHSAL